MLKKTITYTDYDGNERVEDFYFNLSKAEMMELELSKLGGWHAYVERIIKKSDNVEMMNIIKALVCMSYGEKDESGRRFMKSEELTRGFLETEAYSVLMSEIMSSTDSMANFFTAIIPPIPEEDMAEFEKAKLELMKAKE